jgi:hypothetical protein
MCPSQISGAPAAIRSAPRFRLAVDTLRTRGYGSAWQLEFSLNVQQSLS